MIVLKHSAVGPSTAPADRMLYLETDVRLVYRPMTSVDSEAGVAATRRFIAKIRDGRGAYADYGLPPDEIVARLADDEHLAYGVASVVALVEQALRCVRSWEGVVTADGAPAPLDRLHMAALLRDPRYYALVENALRAPLLEQVKEGNGFALSPNGGPEGAQPIAGTAERSEPIAPMAARARMAADAPRKKKRR